MKIAPSGRRLRDNPSIMTKHGAREGTERFVICRATGRRSSGVAPEHDPGALTLGPSRSSRERRTNAGGTVSFPRSRRPWLEPLMHNQHADRDSRMLLSEKPVRAHLSLDPWWDLLTVTEFGSVWDGQPDGCVGQFASDERLLFLFAEPGGPVIGFTVGEPHEFDPEEIPDPLVWGGARFEVPLLGLTAPPSVRSCLPRRAASARRSRRMTQSWAEQRRNSRRRACHRRLREPADGRTQGGHGAQPERGQSRWRFPT